MSDNTQMIEFKRELRIAINEFPPSRDIPIEKMQSVLMVAVQKTPKLLNADRSTFWQSARQCAADGLLPDGREAALLVFKTKINGQFVDAVQYIPMVFGLRKRALNSSQIKDIDAYIVYSGEWEAGRFKMVAGDNPSITHDPILEGAPGEPNRGDPIGAYAIATYKDGHKVREWMNSEQIDKRRRAAPSQKDYSKGGKPVVFEKPVGVWKEWPEEQWLKTLVKAVCKKLPLASDDMSVIMESEYREPAKDITPPETSEQRLLRLAAKSKPQHDDDKTIDAEPVSKAKQDPVEQDKPASDKTDAQTTAAYDEAEVFPGDVTFEEGLAAFKSGATEESCPYTENPDLSNWVGGYRSAKRAASA